MDFLEYTYARQFELHKWEIEFEAGFFQLICKDPCDTFECTPECASHKHPEVISRGMIFDEVEARAACNCGQYAKFLEAFEKSGGRVCACMMTGEEKDALAGTLPVRLVFVDDSTDSYWSGREYSHYVEVHPHVEK